MACWRTVVSVETGKGGDADPALQATLQMSWMLAHNSRRQRAARRQPHHVPQPRVEPARQILRQALVPCSTNAGGSELFKEHRSMPGAGDCEKPRRIAFSNGCAIP